MRPPFTGEDPVASPGAAPHRRAPGSRSAWIRPSHRNWRPWWRGRCGRIRKSDSPTSTQMRSQLEEVQRGLVEEAQRLQRARPRAASMRLLQLRAALVERIGPSRGGRARPALDNARGWPTMQAIEPISLRGARRSGQRSRGPTRWPLPSERATELLRAGQFAEAVGEFEAILAEMPEHARARDGLEQARAQVEVQRRRQLAAELAQDARAALDDRKSDPCLEILGGRSRSLVPPEAVEEMAGLRAAAEAAVAARDGGSGARGKRRRARADAWSGRGARRSPRAGLRTRPLCGMRRRRSGARRHRARARGVR